MSITTKFMCVTRVPGSILHRSERPLQFSSLISSNGVLIQLSIIQFLKLLYLLNNANLYKLQAANLDERQIVSILIDLSTTFDGSL